MMRDEFLSVAAHELKTPLTSLRGFAQLLLRQAGESSIPTRLRPALDAVDRQSAKLGLLVGQLLDVSRLEAGRLALDRQPTDLVPLVRGVVAAIGATSRRHDFQVRGLATAVAFADPLRFEQVVANVIDNAVKYSPKGGPVDVEITGGGGRIRMVVTDDGLGVPPEHRPRIFDRYFQAHSARRLGGMGLGLYISRQIVDLHGGTIEASFPERGGTCVTITIPARGRQRRGH
jgi:signal transduction histidine kinase